MPKFSQESYSKLSTCELDLQVLFFEVIKHYDCVILQGYRNEEDQKKAFEEGNSKLLHGKHNSQPSQAVDVAPYPIDWADTQSFYFLGGFVMGIAQRLYDEGKIAHRIRWGGDWNGNHNFKENKFNDLGHFELI